MKKSKKLPRNKTSEKHQAVGMECDPPPTIPGLFHFVPKLTGGYVAEMEPELYQRYFELRTNAKVEHERLAWALDISSKISPQGLDYLVKKNGWLLLAVSEEECEIEYGVRVNPESRTNQLSVMVQCCQVVLELQRTIGESLKPLLDVRSTCSQQDKAAKLLLAKFRKYLSVLQYQAASHQGGTHVTHPLADGSTIKIPLTVAAIQVAIELATKQLKAPFKHEVSKTLEDRCRSDLIESRDKENLSPINWPDVFKQAGLKGLPVRSGN